MTNQIIVISATASLSAIMTWLVAWVVFRFTLRSQIRSAMEEFADTLEKRVNKGVKDAGREMLPEFQRHVKKGFVEGINNFRPSNEVRNMMKSGADIVEESLTTFLGKKKR